MVVTWCLRTYIGLRPCMVNVYIKGRIEKQKPTQRRMMKVYYISAGRTSLLQVQWRILHWYVFLCIKPLYAQGGVTGNTTYLGFFPPSLVGFIDRYCSFLSTQTNNACWTNLSETCAIQSYYNCYNSCVGRSNK